MFKIALCEENPVLSRILRGMIEKADTMNRLCITDIHQNSGVIEKISELSPDMIFLDENFGNRGIHTAENMKSKFPRSEIIYLTSFPEYLTGSICKTAHISGILKPFRYEDIEKTILSAINTNENRLTQDTRVRCGHSSVTMKLDDIIYLEADKRSTNIRTLEKNFVSTENITSISERLPGLFFFRTHRTYTLNFRHIASIDREIIQMKNGECVILSRQRKKDFEYAYNTFREKIAT
jgi:DNA-binding LytR/AlgR family response regulator